MKSGLIRIAGAAVLVAATALTPSPGSAAGGGFPLDNFPTEKLSNLPALQNGAKLFVNYCLGCHSASYMRYNRLQDIGLTEAQIKENLLFTGEKVGDLMSISMRPADSKEWFGAAPPDLSVTARARSSGEGSGSDWIYTYLRSFYRDDTRPNGWNNALFPNAAMPHVLWQLQGQRGVTITDTHAASGGHGGGTEQVVMRYDSTGAMTKEVMTGSDSHAHAGRTFEFPPATGGTLNGIEYDNAVGDLTAFLTYVSDPTARTRQRLGVWVLLLIAVLFAAAWQLNKAYWRDIR